MSRSLTKLQMQVIGVLWERGEATVAEVQAGLKPNRELARTTVATLLSRLEEKGVVAHRDRGREYVYRPLVTRVEIHRTMVRAFVDRVFGGDVPTMVKELLGSEMVEPDDLRQIRTLLAERQAELDRTASIDNEVDGPAEDP